MTDYEIKVRSAIITMNGYLEKLRDHSTNEVCRSIRYECEMEARGYEKAICDLMRLLNIF